MQKELLQKPQVAEIGQHIGYEAGEEMVKRFFDKHPEQAYGHICGRNIIEQILSQPGCAGIMILPGYNNDGIRQPIFVGVDSNSRPILKYKVVTASGKLESHEGIVSDRKGIAPPDVDTGWWPFK